MPKGEFFSKLSRSSILRRLSIGKLTEFMLNILRNLCKATRIQRDQRPTSVMIWWGVAYDATTKLHFCEKGVNTSPKVYENSVLEPVVTPLNNTLFSNEHWSFKRDLAPTRKANSTKVWLQGIFQTSLLQVIPSNWVFSSSDLNPMDSKSGQYFKVWSVRRGTSISKAWSATWRKQWRISQRRHYVIQ